MFVYKREHLPPDPVFPANLEKLGLFINNKDQIRQIANPELEFKFGTNKNDRYNEVRRMAVNTCIRSLVAARLRALGLITLRLPLSSPAGEPNVPILISSNLSTATRIIVVFGEPSQDLGIWAYRSIGSEGIDVGSAVSFAKAVLRKSGTGAEHNGSNGNGNINGNGSDKGTTTALLLANTGQLIWHCKSRTPVTLQSWLALPRPSAVDPPPMMSFRNKIPGNENWQEHVDYVFNEVLASRGRLVRKDARIDVIGLAEGGLAAVRYLAGNWEDWRPYISAICLSNPCQLDPFDIVDDSDDQASPKSFASFVSSRCRAYVLSDKPLGFPVPGFREHEHVCNCYSAGEALNNECIMVAAWKQMLEWLDATHANPNLCETALEIKEVDVDAIVEGESETGSSTV